MSEDTTYTLAQCHLMNVHFDISIAVPREQVFHALLNGTGLWWGAAYLELKNSGEIILEPRVGGRLYERAGSDDKQGSLLATIVSLQDPEHLILHGNFGLNRFIVNGVVQFDLHEDGDATRLSFSHKAIGEIDSTRESRYSLGWHDLLGRLKFFLEEGKRTGLRVDPGVPF